MLKAMGLADPNITSEQDEFITIGVLWVGFLIYNLTSWIERSPLYGSVYIWVLFALRSEVVSNKSQLTKLTDNVTALLIAHGISMVSLWSWLSSEVVNDATLVDGWDTGLFYYEK